MYKKTVRIWLVFLLGGGLAQAQALSVQGSEQYRSHNMGEVAAFHTLFVSGQTEVDVWQKADAPYSVSLIGPENLVDLVQVESKDGTLSISYKKPLIVLGDHHVRVLVTLPDLQKIEVKESGEVKVWDLLNVAQLHIRADGKAEVDLDKVQAQTVQVWARGNAEVDFNELVCQTLQADAAAGATVEIQRTACEKMETHADNRADISLLGISAQEVHAQTERAGDIELKGKTERASLTARGRSEIDAGSLQADNADVMAASSSHIEVRVAGTLKAQTEGRGVVEYKGWPQQVQQSGKSGQVRKDKKDKVLF